MFGREREHEPQGDAIGSIAIEGRLGQTGILGRQQQCFVSQAVRIVCVAALPLSILGKWQRVSSSGLGRGRYGTRDPTGDFEVSRGLRR